MYVCFKLFCSKVHSHYCRRYRKICRDIATASDYIGYYAPAIIHSTSHKSYRWLMAPARAKAKMSYHHRSVIITAPVIIRYSPRKQWWPFSHIQTHKRVWAHFNPRFSRKLRRKLRKRHSSSSLKCHATFIVPLLISLP